MRTVHLKTDRKLPVNLNTEMLTLLSVACSFATGIHRRHLKIASKWPLRPSYHRRR